jgi:hypothetical protein
MLPLKIRSVGWEISEVFSGSGDITPASDFLTELNNPLHINSGIESPKKGMNSILL